MATTEDSLTPAVTTSPEEPSTGAPSRLYRWGVWVSRHRRAVLAACLVVLLVCASAYPSLQKALGPPDYRVNGSQSARVEQLLEHRFPGLGSEEDALVYHSDRKNVRDPAYRTLMASVDAAVLKQHGVRRIIPPFDREAVGQISPDEHTGITVVVLGGSPQARFNDAQKIQETVARTVRGAGIRAWLTGYSPIAKDTATIQQQNVKRAEGIGLPLALIVLLLAMGALVAASLPILLAISGLILTDGVLAALTTQLHFDSLLLAIVSMIGLGIGIDYSLFVVSRFREELARAQARSSVAAPTAAGEIVEESDERALVEEESDERAVVVEESDERALVDHAVGRALATSGRTIVFSGAIVALSLAALTVINSSLDREIAMGTVVVVVCMLVAATTLLPALLALLGTRVNRGALPARLRPAETAFSAPGGARGDAARPEGWARWARLVMRHPIPAALLATAVLGLLAAPAFHLRLGLNLGVFHNAATPSGEGEKVLENTFSLGAVGPVEVIVTGRGKTPHTTPQARAAAKSLGEKLELDSRVTGVGERHSQAGVFVAVVGSVPIDSDAANALVQRIRKRLAPPIEAHGGPLVLVGGTTAAGIDIANELRSKYPLIILLILAPSLLCLLVAFRSLVLPVKAVLMNLLATGAAVGLVVFVFQDGHGQHLLGFHSVGFIQVGTPLIMFALLFGLSMDYEVFLIRRVQEEWVASGDNTQAVATGLERTARSITAAAAIMVVVFGSFVTVDLLELKQIGFALAAAIALDATLIRFVLVPAVMRLLGARNWWLPGWLARVIPNLRVD
jgi:RND superfamily putative drug exporter